MRDPDEPTPWGPGIACAVAAALVTAAAVTSLGLTLLRVSSLFAVLVMAVMVGGAAPSVARRRADPVWRFVVPGIAAGAAVGVLAFAVDASV
ncbi:DUF2537 domain-containing protein [Rhodococcus sp. SORGH_AS_0301]|uniref:DUF2537 domain-containing protein n=1 Tax=Rhodococcus sp. SORGH_AS_0301 TaxID=3041780 RepID=UPI002789BAAC|nr:DUF2537 domain-containing protein [Rhodococcus sp. SORGH_AS_0301]MDQ1181422.1 hypothetical protein [Rhodococcus sp. SORGH_AS_0301]